MKKGAIILILVFAVLLIHACIDTQSRAKGVYLLIDTSGTYTDELKKAQAIINYLLGTLQPEDSLAVGRIDTGSFSEKDIIAKVTFDKRPSTANNQKRAFQKKIDEFIKSVKESPYTDITGGMLQAVEYLNETGSGMKYILIFSDLKEELAAGMIRDFQIKMDGVRVVALNVTKLRSDNIDPREYMNRLELWKKKVESSGGSWKVINDLERLEKILSD